MRFPLLLPALLIGTMSVLAACQTTPYYKALETVGIKKRDLLIDRAEDVQKSEREASKAFVGAVTVYRETSDADPRNIEGAYRRLESAYEKSRARAGDVEQDIDTLRTVAGDMFTEWESELKLFQDPDIRAASAADLERTRAEFAQLERVLGESVQAMEPALFTLRDRVLYLKHNQTPAAAQALRAQQPKLVEDVRSADAEIRRAIEAADRFLTRLRTSP